MKTIHPLFKQFILNDALNRWDGILKEEGIREGINAGVCFQTSNAFCKILNDDFDIPCKIELVETLIGNPKARELFYYYLSQHDPEAFFQHMEYINQTKGKQNLTKDDPVVLGMGLGKEMDEFHFIMNLPEQGEAIDLTLKRVDRPQWGIKCNNYWAKYDRYLYGKNTIISNEIMNRSGCVIDTVGKVTTARVGLDPEQYKREEGQLREYVHNEVRRRRIPVFFR